MNEITKQPLEGQILDGIGVLLTVGEYEDREVIGLYPTREAAEAALGRWVIEHDGIGYVYPRITQL